MAIQVSGATDPGLARDSNEDSIAFNESAGLCILADGMGGHNAGEVASGMATAFLKAELGNWVAKAGTVATPAELQAAIVNYVMLANAAIFNMAQSTPQYSGMGTTLVVGIFPENYLVLGHIGDSRCYRYRQGIIEQITRDHSLLQEQVDSGYLTETQALHSNNANVVTRALGIDSNVQVEVNLHETMAGDIYLMCSDGLTDMVGDDAIAKILAETLPLRTKSARLVAIANEAGGRDNVSVVLAEVGHGTAKRKLWTAAGRALRNVLGGNRAK